MKLVYKCLRRLNFEITISLNSVDVAAKGSLIFTRGECWEIVTRKLLGCAANHIIIQWLVNHWFTSQQPKEAMKYTTSIDDRVRSVVSINNLIVRMCVGLTRSKAYETLTWSIGAVASSGDSGSGSERSILECVLYNEMTISDKIRVVGLNTGWIIRFKKLTRDVLLFKPNSHVGSTIEVSECSWVVAVWVCSNSIYKWFHGKHYCIGFFKLY